MIQTIQKQNTTGRKKNSETQAKPMFFLSHCFNHCTSTKIYFGTKKQWFPAGQDPVRGCKIKPLDCDVIYENERRKCTFRRDKILTPGSCEIQTTVLLSGALSRNFCSNKKKKKNWHKTYHPCLNLYFTFFLSFVLLGMFPQKFRIFFAWWSRPRQQHYSSLTVDNA